MNSNAYNYNYNSQENNNVDSTGNTIFYFTYSTMNGYKICFFF